MSVTIVKALSSVKEGELTAYIGLNTVEVFTTQGKHVFLDLNIFCSFLDECLIAIRAGSGNHNGVAV